MSGIYIPNFGEPGIHDDDMWIKLFCLVALVFSEKDALDKLIPKDLLIDMDTLAKEDDEEG